jgi:hypothetical protein
LHKFHIFLYCFQKYELIQTEDIPNLKDSEFDPHMVTDIACNILSFLKSNATKEGHTYWLYKGQSCRMLLNLNLFYVYMETCLNLTFFGFKHFWNTLTYITYSPDKFVINAVALIMTRFFCFSTEGHDPLFMRLLKMGHMVWRCPSSSPSIRPSVTLMMMTVSVHFLSDG